MGKQTSAASLRLNFGAPILRLLVFCRSYILEKRKRFAETIDSEKSVGLMKKLGMQLEGIQRSHVKDNDGNWSDLYLYGILKDG